MLTLHLSEELNHITYNSVKHVYACICICLDSAWILRLIMFSLDRGMTEKERKSYLQSSEELANLSMSSW